MSPQGSIPPPVGRSSMFADPTEDRYRATIRYLGAIAHEEAKERPPHAAPSSGPQFVRDVMVPGVVAAHEDAVFKEIVAAISRNRISAVPVVDSEHRVVGVVSEADLLARVTHARLSRPRGHRISARAETRAKAHGATARELMTAPAIVTTPDMPLGEAAWLVVTNRVRRLPVVDEEGRLVGIVSRGDLLAQFLRSDEEIRKDIVENVLVGSYVISAHEVEVTVTEGVVTLRGQVERKSVRNSLLNSVRSVTGVVDVDRTRLTYAVDDTIVATTPARPMY